MHFFMILFMKKAFKNHQKNEWNFPIKNQKKQKNNFKISSLNLKKTVHFSNRFFTIFEYYRLCIAEIKNNIFSFLFFNKKSNRNSIKKTGGFF